MGKIKEWLRDFFLKKAIKKINTPSKIEKSLDDYIADAMKQNADTQRTAQKLLKAKLLKQTTNQTLRDIKNLDEDDEDYEEEPENSFEEKIQEMLLGKILGNVNTAGNAEKGGILPNHVPPTSVSSIPNDTLLNIADNLTAEQKEALKTKFMGGL